MNYTSDKRLCLDAAGKVVDCESTEARELLVGEGGEMPEERARELGLLKDHESEAKAQEVAVAEPEPPAHVDEDPQPEPPADSEAKAQEPAANKARQPAENK